MESLLSAFAGGSEGQRSAGFGAQFHIAFGARLHAPLAALLAAPRAARFAFWIGALRERAALGRGSSVARIARDEAAGAMPQSSAS